MKIQIKDKEFDVQVGGEHPGYVAFLETANMPKPRMVIIATGKTKVEVINNAIVYLNMLVQAEEEEKNAGRTEGEQ